MNERPIAEASIAIGMIEPTLMVIFHVCVPLILESIFFKILPKLRPGIAILCSTLQRWIRGFQTTRGQQRWCRR